MARLRYIYVSVLALIMTACKSDVKVKELAPVKQVELGFRSVNVLTEDELDFKDLNKDGVLNPYEDWRLSVEQRSADLLSRMSLEEKAGFMLISTTRLENDWSFSRPQNNEPITSGFNEVDQVNETNIFTRKPLPYPTISAAGTTKDVTEFHKRHFILRANPSVEILAEYTNNLQELCEAHTHGIPAIITSNPRNHIAIDASIGLTVGKTPFTQWPGELGLAAMRDFELTREFADISRTEWLSVGLRKGYMYMADLATDPRWQRVEGTFGEDADLAARMIREVVLGFQGDSLNATSVALTTKHFPGGGATEGGQDPHFDWGKREVFEADMFQNNLIPFKAAIEAGTSSIMPYYSYPVHTPFPEVGYAFNKEVLQDVLRKELGYEGIINSDTGPIEMMPWGVESLSITERYKMALEAGVNLFSGTADPSKLIETLKANPDLIKQVDHSVSLLLNEKFRLGLFENPYVDVDNAVKVVGNDLFAEQAALAMRKSIVLLRNQGGENEKSLPLKEKTKVYFETYIPVRDGKNSNVYLPEGYEGSVELVSDPSKADMVLLWLVPKGKSLFESDGSSLHVNLSENGIDNDYVNSLIAKKPTILAVNFTNPWAIDEIYSDSRPNNIKAVLATFGTTPEALLDIVAGEFSPTGKMPFTTPVSDEMASKQKSDLPGSMEEEGYALFHFDEGLTYKE
ncbi:glycoside hydrolase family 3 N-terminal domain-containing protein [Euzebyella marina]|nr:glycoside hydrolase family 3 N-terminal domain-containing protein [Euzebyella marina]